MHSNCVLQAAPMLAARPTSLRKPSGGSQPLHIVWLTSRHVIFSSCLLGAGSISIAGGGSTPANYTFLLDSDDGSQLYIDAKLVISDLGMCCGLTSATPSVQRTYYLPSKARPMSPLGAMSDCMLKRARWGRCIAWTYRCCAHQPCPAMLPPSPRGTLACLEPTPPATSNLEPRHP